MGISHAHQTAGSGLRTEKSTARSYDRAVLCQNIKLYIPAPLAALLYLGYDGKHHGAALDLLEEVFRKLITDAVLDNAAIPCLALGNAVLDGLFCNTTHSLV